MDGWGGGSGSDPGGPPPGTGGSVPAWGRRRTPANPNYVLAGLLVTLVLCCIGTIVITAIATP